MELKRIQAHKQIGFGNASLTTSRQVSKDLGCQHSRDIGFRTRLKCVQAPEL